MEPAFAWKSEGLGKCLINFISHKITIAAPTTSLISHDPQNSICKARWGLPKVWGGSVNP